MTGFTGWILFVALMQVACGLSPPPGFHGESSEWYSAEYEFNYFEALLVIVFVMIALMFEVVWHRIARLGEESYSYGHYHEDRARAEEGTMERDSNGNVKHKKLHRELIDRMGGEFMTLGLLAFLIFVVNQTGGFDSLAERTKGKGQDGFAYPETADDWLHLAEMVHIQLFLTVFLYFTLILCLVMGGIQKIKRWEKLQLRARAHRQLHQGTDQQQRASGDRDLKKHLAWREYLITHMLKWKTERPEVFSRALNDLKIDPNASDSNQQFQRAVDEHFSLSVYLSLNLENGVADSIQINFPTWLGIGLLMGFFALFHRYASIDILALQPWFLGASCMLLLSMGLTLKLQRRQIMQFTDARMNPNTSLDSSASSETSAHSEGAKTWLQQMCTVHERWSSERMMLRTLQICLFFLSYAFARVLVDYHDWETRFTTTLFTASAFTVLFLLLAYALPRTVPDFLAVTALPPFVDPVNLEFLFKQLLDDHMSSQEDDVAALMSVDTVSALAQIRV